jgi:hypothetical protein
MVAARQLGATGQGWSIPETGGSALRLSLMLSVLFGDEVPHLDHDPALAVREKVFKNGKHVGYTPDANDPLYLVYRTKAEHDAKTRVRGEHGQFSDHALIRRSKRKNKPNGRKQKIPQRRNPWPSRKMQGRPTFRK